MMLKFCTQYASKFGKLSSGHRTGKGQFSFQSQRRAMPKNVHTITQLCSFQMLKALLQILQARLQEHMNWQLPDIQAGFRKDRRTRDQIANFHWIMEKVRAFQINIYCLLKYAKGSDCVDHYILWKILKERGISGHLTCVLRNLYTDQEATVTSRHGTIHWFKISKGIYQDS